MDNNQFFNANGQQTTNNTQPQMNQAPQMNQSQPNNMFAGQFGQNQPKQPSKFNTNELISLILAGVGFVLVFFGTIFTCTCSASKFEETAEFSTSAVCILTIIGIIVSAVGIVLAIMELKKNNAAIKADKLAKLAVVLGAAAVVFGLLPLLTICGYNCSLANTEAGEALGELSKISSYFR